MRSVAPAGPVAPVAPLGPAIPVKLVTYTVLVEPPQPQPQPLLPPQPLLQHANKIKFLFKIIEFTPLT